MSFIYNLYKKSGEVKCVQKQRGSVTVIAIVMLLFLMVVAIAWLPMMTMEKTAASSDYREQQAWYAAEAGYKRAVAELSAGNNYWNWLSPEAGLKGEGKSFYPIPNSLTGTKVEENGVWYAVSISYDKNDIAFDYAPEAGNTYSITAVGSCQGIRKVIRKDFTLGDNGESGGEEEPPSDILSNDFVVSGGYLGIHLVDILNENVYYNSGAANSEAMNTNKLNFLTRDKEYKMVADAKNFAASTYGLSSASGKALSADNLSGSGNERSLPNGNYWYSGTGTFSLESGEILTLKCSAKNTVLLFGTETSQRFDYLEPVLKLENVVINVPSGSVLTMISNVYRDGANSISYPNTLIKNVTITGGGQVTFICRGMMKITGIKTEGASRVLLISNHTMAIYNPVIADNANGGAFATCGHDFDMNVFDDKSNDYYSWYGQIQSAGLIGINGRIDADNKYHLKLRFKLTGSLMKFPEMAYPNKNRTIV